MISFKTDTPLSYRAHLLLVLTLSAVVLISLIGMGEVYNVGEGREGIVIEEILDSGNYILPLRNGELVPSKPVLFHWIGATLAKALGKANEMDVFALRFPSALAGIGSVLLTFYITALFSNAATGTLASLFLLSTYGFIAISQEGRVDSLFNFLVTLSVSAWLTGFVRHRDAGIARIPSRYYRYAAIACGLAVLTKGPLGFVHVGMVITVVCLSEGGIRATLSLIRPEWVWALLLPTPWYLLAMDAGGDNFVGRQFIYENFRRFTGGAGISKRAWWFYFPHLIRHCGPWSIPFCVLLAQQIKRKGADIFGKNTSLPWLGIRIGILWPITVFCFLNIAAGKHPSYLAPMLPGICIAVAIWFTHVVTWPSVSPLYERILQGVSLVAAAIAPLFVALATLKLLPASKSLAGTIASLPEALSGNGAIFWSVHAALSALIVYHFITDRTRACALNRLGPALLLTLVLLVGVDSHLGRAIKGVTHSYASVGRTLKTLVPTDQTLHWVLRTGTDPALGVGREDSFDGLFFYFRRHVKRLDDSKSWNTPGFYVARRSWIDAQPEEWRARVRPIYTGGKVADKEHQKILYFELLAPVSFGS